MLLSPSRAIGAELFYVEKHPSVNRRLNFRLWDIIFTEGIPPMIPLAIFVI